MSGVLLRQTALFTTNRSTDLADRELAVFSQAGGGIMIDVATVAFAGSWSTEKNLNAMCAHIEQAAELGADLVVFPEIALHGYRNAPNAEREILSDIYQQAENVPDGPSVAALRALARRLGIHVIYGLHERGERPGEIYNSAVLTGPNGHIGVYRKVHVAVTERSVWLPGSSWPVFETDIGRIGLLICWDKVWPESARELTLGGADMLVVIAAWPIHQDFYETFDKVRALENARWLISSNWTGELGGSGYFGIAQIVDPEGRTVATTGVCKAADMAIASIEVRAGIESALANFGGARLERDRRPATYRRWARRELPSAHGDSAASTDPR
jgi:predicted amidohydrolase